MIALWLASSFDAKASTCASTFGATLTQQHEQIMNFFQEPIRGRLEHVVLIYGRLCIKIGRSAAPSTRGSRPPSYPTQPIVLLRLILLFTLGALTIE